MRYEPKVTATKEEYETICKARDIYLQFCEDIGRCDGCPFEESCGQLAYSLGSLIDQTLECIMLDPTES